ncbi:MAG: rubrerythrin-like domain-containing protein [Halobacteriaceae archaeon]
MRPNPSTDDRELYECFECGARTSDAEGRRCECGGRLRNIGAVRDL